MYLKCVYDDVIIVSVNGGWLQWAAAPSWTKSILFLNRELCCWREHFYKLVTLGITIRSHIKWMFLDDAQLPAAYFLFAGCTISVIILGHHDSGWKWSDFPVNWFFLCGFLQEVRRRHRYLAHLPLTCEFSICELALQPPILSKETLDTFAGRSSFSSFQEVNLRL